MRVPAIQPLHLTYCTNIHAANGWPAVRAAIGRYAPALKARLSPDAPFGLGLRLSARDARELAEDGLDEFRAFLEREDLYVALINGFPHGSFHGAPVKADVYAPDWHTDERVRYTLQLIDILAALMPPGIDGGVSTVPLSYKPWGESQAPPDWNRLVDNVTRVAEHTARIRQQGGPLVHLDLEPEPDCLLETTTETVSFFEHRLLPAASPHLADRLGLTVEAARSAVLEHVRVCFDCCHVSVEHEDPRVALGELRRAGIRVGRIQLSSALIVDMAQDRHVASDIVARLKPFADSTYLHQVICRHDRSLWHFADLGPALDQPTPGEWRIHFHVPLFAALYGDLGSSQRDVADVLSIAASTPLTSHLEIETYTWDVLPSTLKIDLGESIAREYEWVLAELARFAPRADIA